MRNSVRVAAIVIILIGGSFGIDVLRRNESLTVQPTIDEQQNEIRGNATQGTFVINGHADADKQVNVIGSSELDDAMTVLGYTPDVPTWLPEGWVPLNYFASTSQHASVFRMKYQQSTDKNLVKFSVTKYNDIERALVAFQQSKNGTSYHWNGMTVYVSVNIDEPVAIWLVDSTCYSLSGPLSNEEIRLIIESIQRSETNNET